MPSTHQILQRSPPLLEPKHPIHDWLDAMLVVERHNVLEPIPRPVDETLDRDVPRQRQQVKVRPALDRLVLLAREVADAADEAAKGHALQRPVQGVGAAALKDDVGAAAGRQLHDFVLPLWGRAVVDQVVCAEGFGLLEFVVGRGCHDCCVVELC